MATFNINPNVIDPNYRYKMPGIQVNIEPIPKRRNRCQTTITNIDRVAKALGVQGIPPEFILKWISLELGVQMKIIHEARKSRTVTYHNLLAAIQSNQIQPKLASFIENWILCRNCENPETDIWNLDKNTVAQICYACGAKNDINKTGKFETFLRSKLPNSRPIPPKRYHEKIEDAPKTNDVQLNSEIEGWTETDQIVQDDMEIITQRYNLCIENSGLTKLADNSDIMAQIPSSTRAHFFLGKLQDENTSHRQIQIMVELLELKSKLVKPVLRFLKWDGKKLNFQTLKASIERNQALLEAICQQDTLALERLILGFVQKVIGKNKKSLLEYTANIIHLLYAEDIISEDVILEWATSSTNKFVKPEIDRQLKLKCQKIFDWLRTADSESSEDESCVSYTDIKNYVKRYYDYESEQESDAESEIDIDKI